MHTSFLTEPAPATALLLHPARGLSSNNMQKLKQNNIYILFIWDVDNVILAILASNTTWNLDMTDKNSRFVINFEY